MPTIQSDQVAQNSPQVLPFPAGSLAYRKATVSLTAAQAGDNTLVIEMLPIFKNERVVDLFLVAEDLDSGIAALILDVGDGLVTDRYIDGADVGGTGGTHRMLNAAAAAPSATEFPHDYAANDTIDVSIQVAAATGQAGSITLVALVSAG
jgi:hypothetical protein